MVYGGILPHLTYESHDISETSMLHVLRIFSKKQLLVWDPFLSRFHSSTVYTVYTFILIQSRIFSHMATVFLYDI